MLRRLRARLSRSRLYPNMTDVPTVREALNEVLLEAGQEQTSSKGSSAIGGLQSSTLTRRDYLGRSPPNTQGDRGRAVHLSNLNRESFGRTKRGTVGGEQGNVFHRRTNSTEPWSPFVTPSIMSPHHHCQRFSCHVRDFSIFS